MQVIEDSSWQFGVAYGFGERTNPLVGSKDDRIPIIIHLTYDNDNFFFDNGDLGYYLTEGKSWELNVLAGLNSERHYFTYLNRMELNIASDPNEPPGSSDSYHQVMIDPPKRDTTVDGGFELLVDSELGDFQLQLLTDISQKHKGQELWLGYNYTLKLNDWKLEPGIALIFKSKNWTNYFYGVNSNEVVVDPNDQSVLRPFYFADESFNQQIRIKLSYQLSKNWYVISLLEKELLDSNIKSSPIVKDNSIDTFFLGFYQKFN